MAVGIELKEELLKVEQVIGETTARKVLREVIKIADTLPTAEKIISVDVIIITTSFQLIKNKILVEGTAKVRILYVAREATGAQPVQVCLLYTSRIRVTIPYGNCASMVLRCV